MKRRKFFIGLNLAAILVATLACSALPFSTTPTVSNIRMATDNTGDTSTSSYAPGDPFYVFADLSHIKTGSVIEAQWYVVNAEGLDPNSPINTSDYS